jgi:hypothetical protein
MQYLCQRDPRWANQRIGASSLTLGRYGCTTVCLSMLSDHFGNYIKPPQVAQNIDWYTPQGLVLWGKLAIPKMKFVKRLRVRSLVDIYASLNDPDGAVMLEVSHGSHWIVGLRKTWLRDDVICIDPWTGRVCSAIGDYKNITGSAHFKRA